MTDHPKITGDHIFIFMPLYEQLRQSPCDKTGYNKTNEFLSEFSKASLSTVKRKLNDLEVWGFLSRIGMGYNRKFFLGINFVQQGQIDLVNNGTTGSERPITGSQRPSTGSKTHYIAKNIVKNINKNTFAYATSTSKPKNEEVVNSEYLNEMKLLKNLGIHNQIINYEEWKIKKGYV